MYRDTSSVDCAPPPETLLGSALLFIVRSRLLIYSAGSGVNRVQVVLSGFSREVVLFCPGKNFV